MFQANSLKSSLSILKFPNLGNLEEKKTRANTQTYSHTGKLHYGGAIIYVFPSH